VSASVIPRPAVANCPHGQPPITGTPPAGPRAERDARPRRASLNAEDAENVGKLDVAFTSKCVVLGGLCVLGVECGLHRREHGSAGRTGITRTPIALRRGLGRGKAGPHAPRADMSGRIGMVSSWSPHGLLMASSDRGQETFRPDEGLRPGRMADMPWEGRG